VELPGGFVEQGSERKMREREWWGLFKFVGLVRGTG